MEALPEIFNGALSGFGSALGAAVFSGVVSIVLRLYRALVSSEDVPEGWYDNSAVFSPGQKKRKVYSPVPNKEWRKQFNIGYPYVWQTISAILFVVAVVLYLFKI